MLEYEIAALYYLANETLGITSYFDSIPEGMAVPCIFYPAPESSGGSFSTSSYATSFTLYANIFDISTPGAYEKGAALLETICGNRYKIPLVDGNGKKTGRNFRVGDVKLSKADECVYQLEITWTRYTRYTEKTYELAREFFFNGKSI